MFAYCNNCPVLFTDASGTMIEALDLFMGGGGGGFVNASSAAVANSVARSGSSLSGGSKDALKDRASKVGKEIIDDITTGFINTAKAVGHFIAAPFSTPERAIDTFEAISHVTGIAAVYLALTVEYTALPTFGLSAAAVGPAIAITSAVSVVSGAIAWLINKLK